MPPRGLQHPQFATWDEILLGGAVRCDEKHIAADRHPRCPGLDAPQRRGEVALRVATDIGVLPLPRHAEEIVWVHRQEGGLEEVQEEVVERRKSYDSQEFGLEETSRETHQPPQASGPAT